jgi:aryl-alcohol dehydrogenase-like predicted oxidoreductase
MERRSLGRSGLQVSPLCFGGNVFGWTADEATSFHLLDAFLDAGFNFVDTADVYSVWVRGHRGGESETILGRWMKARGNRERVVVATKVGMEMGPGRKGLRPAYIRASVEDSLKRLQTDVIDLYQTHQDDPDTPFEETLGALADLVREGKVRAIGASNIAADRLTLALATSRRLGLPRYESLQPGYNLYDRNGFEGPLQRLCLEHGLGVIPYFSLGAGFLTGKYRSPADLEGRARAGRVGTYLNERGFRILAALDRAAEREGATQAQIALAWLLSRPGLTAPIVSATSVEQLREILPAASLALSPESLAEFDRASA